MGRTKGKSRNKENKKTLGKREQRQRERQRPKKLKKTKIEFKEDVKSKKKDTENLEALKAKIRKSKLEKKGKDDLRETGNLKRQRKRTKRNLKVKEVAKSKAIRAKNSGRSKRKNSGENGKRRKRTARRRAKRPARKRQAESASSSSIDFSSISMRDSPQRPFRRRRRYKRKHFDTTSSSSESQSDFNDNVDPKQREKQVRLARLRAMEWEKRIMDRPKQASGDEVSFHGSVSLSDIDQQKPAKSDSSNQSVQSQPENPETDLAAEIEHQEKVLLDLEQNPDITAEAIQLVKKNLEELRERERKNQEERLRQELDRKFEEMRVEEVNQPKPDQSEKPNPNNIVKLSSAQTRKQKDELTFMIEEGLVDELENGLDQPNPPAEKPPQREEQVDRLVIVQLTENLKAKFMGPKQASEMAQGGELQANGRGLKSEADHKPVAPKLGFALEEETGKASQETDMTGDGESDTLEQYMSQIKEQAVEQEEFNYNAVRNNYLPIDKRKDDIGGLKIEEEEVEEEVNVITGEELMKMMKLGNETGGFNVPRKPPAKAEEGEKEGEEDLEEQPPEYDETELEFINALKNSTVLFGNQVDDSKVETKPETEKKSDDEFCDDNEVADQMNIEEHLKKTTGMESSSQKIDKIRSTYLEKKKKMEKKKMLKRIDHSSIIYEPIRKDLYRESTEISSMTEEEVAQKRRELGDIKIRGTNQIKPLFSWYHCGLPRKILKLLVDKLHYRDPFPIQCQCIPIILSGRDCIGVAETGSGKTLAYVLPMIRHIKDQKPLEEGDGPIGLVMVPTRELASQVFSTVRIFCKVVGLRAAAIFGGASLSSQFSELKKGAEVVVSTPGRLIDILTTSNGKITNLRRVTYIVLDEADRMFDLGFEPQINRIIGNVRPSRQTVLFSATFPRNVEALAKRILSKPLEVVVGTRGQASKNITQKIEIIEEDQKLFRLLELLGVWTDRGSVIVFVDQQSQADKLYQSLLRYKYVPLLLHGGQDQDDRSNTIADFKKNSKRVLITTSLGARGLDIKWVILVVNYYCPPFKEDYIHRIGRTGRAGRKGFAVTMITAEEDKFAGDLIQALQISNSEVPEALMEMHQKFREKVMRGEAQDFKNKNLGGRGFKFDHNELAKFRAIKKIISKQYGLAGKADADDEDVKYLKGLESSKKVEKNQIKLIRDPKVRNAIKKAAVKAAGEAIMAGKSNEDVMIAAQNAIRDFLFNYDPENPASFANLSNDRELKIQSGILKHDDVISKVSVEFEIDSYPEITRKKITGRDYLSQIGELTCCQISIRGILSKGSGNVFGQKKLHIFIEGDTRVSVMNALYEINKTAEESAMNALSYGSSR